MTLSLKKSRTAELDNSACDWCCFVAESVNMISYTVFTGETFTTAVIFRSNYRLLKVQKQSGNSWIWFAKKRDHVQNYTKFLVRGKRKCTAPRLARRKSSLLLSNSVHFCQNTNSACSRRKVRRTSVGPVCTGGHDRRRHWLTLEALAQRPVNTGTGTGTGRGFVCFVHTMWWIL